MRFKLQPPAPLEERAQLIARHDELIRDEAMRIAANIAKLPDLLGAERPEGNPLTQRRP